MDSRQPERKMLTSPEDVENYSGEFKKKACCLTNKVVKFHSVGAINKIFSKKINRLWFEEYSNHSRLKCWT
jgi:hypothetical protein